MFMLRPMSASRRLTGHDCLIRPAGYSVQSGKVLSMRGSGPETQTFFGEVSPPQKLSIMNVPNSICTAVPHPRHKNDAWYLASKPTHLPKRGVQPVVSREPVDCVGILKERVRDMMHVLYLALEDQLNGSFSGQLAMDRLCSVMEEAGFSLAQADLRGLERAYCKGQNSSVDVKALSVDLLQLVRRPAGCYERMPHLIRAVARRLKLMVETMGTHWERRDRQTMPSYQDQPGSQPSGFVNQEHFLEELKMWKFGLGRDGVKVALLQAYNTDQDGVKQGFVNYRSFLRDLDAACSSYLSSKEFNYATMPSSVDMFAGSLTSPSKTLRVQRFSAAPPTAPQAPPVGAPASAVHQQQQHHNHHQPQRHHQKQPAERSLGRFGNSSPMSVTFEDESVASSVMSRPTTSMSVQSLGMGGGGSGGAGQGLVSGARSRAASRRAATATWKTNMTGTCHEVFDGELRDFWSNMHLALIGFEGIDSKRKGYVPERDFEDVMRRCCSSISVHGLEYLCRRFGDSRGRVEYGAFLSWALVACPEEFTVPTPKGPGIPDKIWPSSQKSQTLENTLFRPIASRKKLRMPSKTALSPDEWATMVDHHEK